MVFVERYRRVFYVTLIHLRSLAAPHVRSWLDECGLDMDQVPPSTQHLSNAMFQCCT